MWLDFKIFIHRISDYLEAIGFLVSIFVAFKLFFLNRELKILQSKHLFQVRVDDHLNDLRDSSKKLSNLISNINQNIKEIKNEISKCIEHCNSLNKKVHKGDLDNLLPLINIMTKIRNNNISMNSTPNLWQRLIGKKPIEESQIDDVYNFLSALITELENFNNDLKKSIV